MVVQRPLEAFILVRIQVRQQKKKLTKYLIVLDLSNMEPSLIVSIFALLFSIASITWNIVRDVLLDNVKLSTRMFLGEEMVDEKGKSGAVSAGAEINIRGIDKVVLPEKVFFKIVNVGRRDIEIDCIRAEYANGTGWHFPIKERRYLKPYESTNGNTGNPELKRHLKNKTVKIMYVQDTKGKKWDFSDDDITNASKQ